MLPEGARNYLLQGLEATPVIADALMQRATEAHYDRRPAAERFTLREALAHMADWEPIWIARIEKIQKQDNPTLASHDPDEYAAQHDYAHADVVDCQARFREQRAVLVQTLRRLPETDWALEGYHTEWGKISVEGLATLILGHDAYHLRQIAEWVASE